MANHFIRKQMSMDKFARKNYRQYIEFLEQASRSYSLQTQYKNARSANNVKQMILLNRNTFFFFGAVNMSIKCWMLSLTT